MTEQRPTPERWYAHPTGIILSVSDSNTEADGPPRQFHSLVDYECTMIRRMTSGAAGAVDVLITEVGPHFDVIHVRALDPDDVAEALPEHYAVPVSQIIELEVW